MKITMYELLGLVKDGKMPKKIIFNGYEYSYHDKEHGYCRSAYDSTYICLDTDYYLFDILNDIVEILEEEKKFTKEDFIKEAMDLEDITREEFNKRYEVKKCNCGREYCKGFIKVEKVQEEKKIPEKITINDNGTLGFPNGQWTARNMDKAFAVKINQLIDYLESKGE